MEFWTKTTWTYNDTSLLDYSPSSHHVLLVDKRNVTDTIKRQARHNNDLGFYPY